MAKPPLHVAPLVSASYGTPLHVRRSHVLRRPFDRAKATVRAAPSTPNQPTTPPRPHWASEASRLDCLPPCTGAYPMRGASDPFTPSVPKVCILRDRRGWELFLRNNAHITQAASVLPLNHHCILQQKHVFNRGPKSATGSDAA
jgi:hypothetical protein